MADRQTVSSGAPWESIVGYARAVRVGSRIAVAGTTATDDAGQVVGAGDAGAQTRFILERVEAALTQCGGSLADVVRTRMYVTDITNWEPVGAAHNAVFAEIRPAATMVEVSRLIDPELLVEIEVEAELAG